MIALRIGLLLALGLTLALAEDEVIKCPEGECVKLHLCRDGTISTDGSNLIDIRFNADDPCEHYLLKCCAVPDAEDGEIIEPPSTGGESEFIVPPSSGLTSENSVGSNSGSTASSGSTGGSSGSSGSAISSGPSGSTGSSGPSGSSEGQLPVNGREQESVNENPGNYHGGSYPHGGGSFSSTYSQSSSSSSSQSNQQQWTGPQGSIGMGVGGGGGPYISGSSGNGTDKPGSVGYNSGLPGINGQGSGQTGFVGHSTAQGYDTSQSAINAHGTGQGTDEMGSQGHGGRQPGLTGQGSGQMVSGGYHTGSIGLSTGQSGSTGHTVSQTGTTTGAQAGHGTSQSGIKAQGTGQTGQGTSEMGSLEDGGRQPGSTGQGQMVSGGDGIVQTDHGTVHTGSVGLGTGQTKHSTGQNESIGNTISQTGASAGGSLGSQHGTSGYNRTESTSGVSSGSMHGSTGSAVSSANAGPSLGGSSTGGYLVGSNLVAGDLHGGITGASGTHTGAHSVQGQITGNHAGESTHQTEQFNNVDSTNGTGGQSEAYQAGAANSMHGTGNIVLGVGTVTKDQTKDTSNVNVGISTSNTSGISQHGQASSNHQYQDNSSSTTSQTSQNTQSTNSVGSNQGHGQNHTGSSTVKHYEGDGCTSHTQKHTTHTQHHGHANGNEQTQHIYGSDRYPGTTVNPIIPPQENAGCGFRNPDGVGFRITGNTDSEAEYGEFPWMVAILKEEKALDQVINVYQCGGSLIHPRVVLTAAHCVQNKKPHEIKVRLGEWDTQTTNEIHDHQDRNVDEIVVHDKFYKGGLFNNFALLFLDKPAEIIDTVNTVCLPPQGFNFDGSRCFASGWGKDVFGKEGKYQVILKKIELPIMPFKQCQEALRTTRVGPRFNLNKSFICAGGEPKKDTCKGDGGSPLVCPIPGSPNRFYQAGIVSWGIGCGETGIPGVYANVAGFRTWIDEHLTQRSIPHNYYIAV